MEVVCLILGTTLTSQTCSHTFWVLTSLHLPFLLKMFFIILLITNMMKILPVLLLAGGSTLKMISNCLEDVVSHKNTRYQKVCVY